MTCVENDLKAFFSLSQHERRERSRYGFNSDPMRTARRASRSDRGCGGVALRTYVDLVRWASFPPISPISPSTPSLFPLSLSLSRIGNYTSSDEAVRTALAPRAS